jgi:tyrosyl-tRNA synthetase
LQELNKDISKELARQWELISRGAVEIIPEEEFKERLKKSIEDNVPLRIKQGFDPTAPDIHIGHTVGIRKLKQFQELGHKIILIIGDYTGLVGDPSGRSATRPQLSYETIRANAETYQKQFFKILDKSATEVHYNGEWFSKMSFKEIMELASKFTVARMLERDDFEKRYRSGSPISIHEMFYPLIQAYDSVAIKADVEIGATEQKFNLLTGREIQLDYGVRPQMILTLPVLVGLDGQNRMSKSLGNYIGIDEAASEIFGKVMSIPDNLIYSYFELTTDLSQDELSRVKKSLESNVENPMNLKKLLGESLVRMYHNAEAAKVAREEFEKVFSRKELPDEIPEYDCRKYNGKVWVVRLLTDSGLVSSNSEARRLIAGGGVYLDQVKVPNDNYEITLSDGMLIKVGKRKFLRLRT